MDVSLRQIRSFIAVAKASSFTQAAASLNMSQPALTVQIRQLEEVLRVRLLDRNSRTVDLTRIGRELLPALERTVEDLDAVLLETKLIADERRGVVRIAALPSFAAGSLPNAINEFRKIHPGISFSLRDVIGGLALDLVRSEEMDLGIVGGETPADVEVLSEASEGMVVIHPRGHPIAKARAVTASTLAAYPLILMHPKTSVRAVTDAAFGEAALVVSPATEVTYMMTAVGMVLAGLGLAILPETAREAGAEPGLVSRRIDDPAFLHPIALIKKAGRTLAPATQTFAEHLARTMNFEKQYPNS